METESKIIIYSNKNDLKQATKDINPELYIDVLNQQGNHTFTYFKTHQELFEQIDNLKLRNGRYYINELIVTDQKRKPYSRFVHYRRTNRLSRRSCFVGI